MILVKFYRGTEVMKVWILDEIQKLLNHLKKEIGNRKFLKNYSLYICSRRLVRSRIVASRATDTGSNPVGSITQKVMA